MAIFDENLKPEENDSGFTADETDNESFILDSFGGKYPEEVPDFDNSTFLNLAEESSNFEENLAETEEIQDETEEIPSETEEVQDEIEITEENLENVEESSTENENIEEKVANISNKDEEYQEIDFGENKENVATNEAEINENQENADFAENINTEDENPEAENIEDENQENQTNENESIDLDDDFKNLLINDLDREKNKNISENEEQHSNENEDETLGTLKFDDTDFEQVGQNSEPDLTADLINMDFKTKENPEKSPIEENEEKLENNENFIEFNASNDINETQNVKNVKKNNEENQTKLENQKENNNKNRTFLIILSILIAAILVIGGVIGYFYLKNKKNINLEPSKKITKLVDTKKPKPVEIKEDTILLEEENKSEKSNLEDSNLVISEKNIEENNEKNIKKEEPKKPQNVDRNINKSFAQKNRIPRKTETKSNFDKIDIVKKNETIQPQTNQIQPNEKGIFVIQVYASPSKADAETRLELLRQKNINGSITTQIVKGKTWYRVRFGSFSTYDAAKSAATANGFSEAWIERIK
jgi:cell division protein FtsN